jgi:UDP-N-acetylglucosamine--N-acetylmuramyl-(pentapeptide) pyrophosphoryl-undecaprenol N-acetylglucosamine transferase
VKAGYAGARFPHEVFPFTDSMEKYYSLADVVISRAGASTIFELAYFKKAAILVPYPSAEHTSGKRRTCGAGWWRLRHSKR